MTAGVRPVLIAAVAGAAAAAALPAQQRRLHRAEALPLVVRVVSTFGTSAVPEVGAGILVGSTPESLYVATACHVVLRREPANEVRVALLPDSATDAPASIRNRPERCAPLDLAVLVLPRRAARGAAARALAFDRRGEPRALRFGDPVSAIGCPTGECWEVPGAPDDFVRADSLNIVFQSEVVQRGSSGGALFNEWWEVVGMVTEDQPPRALALRVDRLVAQLEAWRVPVSLRRPAIPRAGYHSTIGATLFVTTPSPFSRVPAGRLTLTVRGSGSRMASLVVLHAGVSRFAPANLSINAGVAGGGLVWRPRERVTVHAFVEAAYASIEGRLDTNGYYVTSAGGTRYVPVWTSVRGNGAGAGAATALELGLFPGVIGELVVGYWSFTTPQPLPSFGRLQVGLGVRRGR